MQNRARIGLRKKKVYRERLFCDRSKGIRIAQFGGLSDVINDHKTDHYRSDKNQSEKGVMDFIFCVIPHTYHDGNISVSLQQSGESDSWKGKITSQAHTASAFYSKSGQNSPLRYAESL